MQNLIFLIVLVQSMPILADKPDSVVVLKNTDVKSFDKALAAKLDDRKAAREEVGNAGGYQTSIIRREGDGDVESESDSVLLIIERGQATLKTGNIPDSKAGARGDLGSARAPIQGGQSTEVDEGDVVVIPANLPHQLLVAPGKGVTYVVIRPQRPESQLQNASASAPAPPAALGSHGKNSVQGADLGSGFRACIPGDNSSDGTVVDGYRKLISHSFLGPSCIWKAEAPAETVTTGAPGDKKTARPGADVGEGYRSCLPGDSSPSGTIVDGYRKVMTTSPFGVSCGWEKMQ
jgi:mannose-6-phosphate isomerase-like protein (cupin superfamily)